MSVSLVSSISAPTSASQSVSTGVKTAAATQAEIDSQYNYINSNDYFSGFSGNLTVTKGVFGWNGGFTFTDQNGYTWTRGKDLLAGTAIITIKRADGSVLKTFSEVSYKPGKFLGNLPSLFAGGATQFSGQLNDTSGAPIFRFGAQEARYASATATAATLYQIDMSADYLAGRGPISAVVNAGGVFSASVGGANVQGRAGSRDFTVNGVNYTGNASFGYMASVYDQFRTTTNGILTVDGAGGATFYTPSMQTTKEVLNISASGQRSITYSGTDYLVGLSGNLSMGAAGGFTLTTTSKTITGNAGSNSFTVTDKTTGVTTSYTGALGGNYLKGFNGRTGTLATVAAAGPVSLTETGTNDIYTADRATGATTITHANYLRYRRTTLGDQGDGTGAFDAAGNFSYTDTSGNKFTQDTPVNGVGRIKLTYANGTTNYLSGTLASSQLLSALKGQYAAGTAFAGILNVSPADGIGAKFTDDVNNKILTVSSGGVATAETIDYLRGKSGTVTYDAAGKWTFTGGDGEIVSLEADPTYIGSNPPILIKSRRPAPAGTGNTEIVTYYKGGAGSGYLASLAAVLTPNVQGIRQAQLSVSSTGAVSARNYETNQRFEIAKGSYSSSGIDWNSGQAQKGTLDLLRGQTGTVTVTSDGKISFQGDVFAGSSLSVDTKTVNDFIQYKLSPTAIFTGWVGGAYVDFLKGRAGTLTVTANGKQVTFTDSAEQRAYVLDIPNPAVSGVDINTVSGASDYLVGKAGSLAFTADGFTLTTDTGETISGKLNESKLSVTKNGDSFLYQDTAAPYTSTYIQSIKTFLGSKSTAGARLSISANGTATFQTTAMQTAGEVLLVTATGDRNVTYTGGDYLNGLSGTLTVGGDGKFALVSGSKTIAGTIGSTSFNVTDNGVTTSYTGAIGGSYLNALKGKTGQLDTVPATGSIKFTDGGTGLVYTVNKATAETTVAYTGADYLNGLVGTATVGTNGSFTFQSGQTVIRGTAGGQSFTVTANGVTTTITGKIGGNYLAALSGKTGTLTVPGDGASDVTFTDTATGDIYNVNRTSGIPTVSYYANFLRGNTGTASIDAAGTFSFLAPWGTTYSVTATQAANGIFTDKSSTGTVRTYTGVLIAPATLAALKAQFGNAPVTGTLAVDATGAATFQTAAMQADGETLSISVTGARSATYSGPDYLNGKAGTLTVAANDQFTLISGSKTIVGSIGSSSFTVTENGVTTSFTGAIGGNYLNALKGRTGALAAVPVAGTVSFTEAGTGDIYTITKTTGASVVTYANYLRGQSVSVAVDAAGRLSVQTADGTVLTQNNPSEIKRVAANGTVSYLSGTLAPPSLLTAIVGLYTAGQTGAGTLTVAADGSARYVDQAQNKTVTATSAGVVTAGVIDYLRGKSGAVVFDAAGSWTFYSNDGETVTQAAGANHKEPAGLGYLTDLGAYLNTTDPYQRYGLIQIGFDGTVNFTNFSTNQRTTLTAASYASGHIDWSDPTVKKGILDVLRSRTGHIAVSEQGLVSFTDSNGLVVAGKGADDFATYRYTTPVGAFALSGWAGGAYTDFLKGKTGTFTLSGDGQKATFIDDKDGALWQIDVKSEVPGNIDIIRADGSADYLTGKSGTVQFNGDLFTIGLDNGETVSGRLGTDTVYVKRGSDTFIYHDTAAPYTSAYLQAVRTYAGTADLTGSRLQVAQDGTVTFHTADMAAHSLALEIAPTGQQTILYGGSHFLAGAQGSLTVTNDGAVTLDTGSRVIRGQIGSQDFTVTENGMTQAYRGNLGADYLAGLKGLSGTLQLLPHTPWQNFTETATGDIYAVNSITGEVVHNYTDYIRGKAGAITIDPAGVFGFTDTAGNSFSQISASQFKKTSADGTVSILSGTLADQTLITAITQLYQPGTAITALLSVMADGRAALIDNDQNKFAQIAPDGTVRSGMIDYLRGKSWTVTVDASRNLTFSAADGEIVSGVLDPTGQGRPTIKSVLDGETRYITGYLGNIGLVSLSYMNDLTAALQPGQTGTLDLAADGGTVRFTDFSGNRLITATFTDAAILADSAPAMTVGVLDALRGKTGQLSVGSDGAATFTTDDGVTYRSLAGNSGQYSVQYGNGPAEVQNGQIGPQYLPFFTGKSGRLTVSADGGEVDFTATESGTMLRFGHADDGQYRRITTDWTDFLSGKIGDIAIDTQGRITFTADSGEKVEGITLADNYSDALLYTDKNGVTQFFAGRFGGEYLSALKGRSGRIAAAADGKTLYFVDAANGERLRLQVADSFSATKTVLPGGASGDILAGKTGTLTVDQTGGFVFTTSDGAETYRKDAANPGILVRTLRDGTRSELLDLTKREELSLLRGRSGTASIKADHSVTFTDALTGTKFDILGQTVKTTYLSYIDALSSGTLRWEEDPTQNPDSWDADRILITLTGDDGTVVKDHTQYFQHDDGVTRIADSHTVTAVTQDGKTPDFKAVNALGEYLEKFRIDGVEIQKGQTYRFVKTVGGVAIFDSNGWGLVVNQSGALVTSGKIDALAGLSGQLSHSDDGINSFTVTQGADTLVYRWSGTTGQVYHSVNGADPVAVEGFVGLNYLATVSGSEGALQVGLDGTASLTNRYGDKLQVLADGSVKTTYFADYTRNSTLTVQKTGGIVTFHDQAGLTVSQANGTVTLTGANGKALNLNGQFGGAYLPRVLELLGADVGDVTGLLDIDTDGTATWLDRTHNRMTVINPDGTTRYSGTADLLAGKAGLITVDTKGGYIFEATDLTIRYDAGTGMTYVKRGAQEFIEAQGNVGGPYLAPLKGKTGALAVGTDGQAVFVGQEEELAFDTDGFATVTPDAALLAAATGARSAVASHAPTIVGTADGGKRVTYSDGSVETVSGNTDALAGSAFAQIEIAASGNYTLTTDSGEVVTGVRRADGGYDIRSQDRYGFDQIRADGYGLNIDLVNALRQILGPQGGSGTLAVGANRIELWGATASPRLVKSGGTYGDLGAVNTDDQFKGKSGTLNYSISADGQLETASLTIGSRSYRQTIDRSLDADHQWTFEVFDTETGLSTGLRLTGRADQDRSGIDKIRLAAAQDESVDGRHVDFAADGTVRIGAVTDLEGQLVLTATAGQIRTNPVLQGVVDGEETLSGGGWIAVDKAGNFTFFDAFAHRTIRKDDRGLVSIDVASGQETQLAFDPAQYSLDLLKGRKGYVSFNPDGSFRFQDDTDGSFLHVGKDGIATAYAATETQEQRAAEKLAAQYLQDPENDINAGRQQLRLQRSSFMENLHQWNGDKGNLFWAPSGGIKQDNPKFYDFMRVGGTPVRNLIHGGWLAARRIYGAWVTENRALVYGKEELKPVNQALEAFFVIGAMASIGRVAFNAYDLFEARYLLGDAHAQKALDKRLSQILGNGGDIELQPLLADARKGEAIYYAGELKNSLNLTVDADKQVWDRVNPQLQTFLETGAGVDELRDTIKLETIFWSERKIGEIETKVEESYNKLNHEIDFVADPQGDLKQNLEVTRVGAQDQIKELKQRLRDVSGESSFKDIFDRYNEIDANLDGVKQYNDNINQTFEGINENLDPDVRRNMVEGSINNFVEGVFEGGFVGANPGLPAEISKRLNDQFLSQNVQNFLNIDGVENITLTANGVNFTFARGEAVSVTTNKLQQYRAQLEIQIGQNNPGANLGPERLRYEMNVALVKEMAKSNKTALNAFKIDDASSMDIETYLRMDRTRKFYLKGVDAIFAQTSNTLVGAGARNYTEGGDIVAGLMLETIETRRQIGPVTQAYTAAIAENADANSKTALNRAYDGLVEYMDQFKSMPKTMRVFSALRYAARSIPTFLGGVGYMGQIAANWGVLSSGTLGQTLEYRKAEAYLKDRGQPSDPETVRLVQTASSFQVMSQFWFGVDGLTTFLPGISAVMENAPQWYSSPTQPGKITGSAIKQFKALGRWLDRFSWVATTINAVNDAVWAGVDAGLQARLGNDLLAGSRAADVVSNVIGAFPLVGTAFVGFAASIVKGEYVNALSTGEFEKAEGILRLAAAIPYLGFSTLFTEGVRDLQKAYDDSLPAATRQAYHVSGGLNVAAGAMGAAATAWSAFAMAGWLSALGPIGIGIGLGIFLVGAIGLGIAGAVTHPSARPNYDIKIELDATTKQYKATAVEAQQPKLDGNGNPLHDANGNIIYETIPGFENTDVAGLASLNDRLTALYNEYAKRSDDTPWRYGRQLAAQSTSLPVLRVRTDNGTGQISIAVNWDANNPSDTTTYYWDGKTGKLTNASGDFDLSANFMNDFVQNSISKSTRLSEEQQKTLKGLGRSDKYAAEEKTKSGLNADEAVQQNYAVVKKYNSGAAGSSGEIFGHTVNPAQAGALTYEKLTVSLGAGEGMMIIDRDGDGRVTDSSELLFLGDPSANVTFRNDLAWLANEQSSGAKGTFGKPGTVTAAAKAAASLMAIWSDLNGDGVLAADEIKYLYKETSGGTSPDPQNAKTDEESRFSFEVTNGQYAMTLDQNLRNDPTGALIFDQKQVETRAGVVSKSSSSLPRLPRSAILSANLAGAAGHDRQTTAISPAVSLPSGGVPPVSGGLSTRELAGKYGSLSLGGGDPDQILQNESPIAVDEVFTAFSDEFEISLDDLLANDFDRGFQSNIGLFVASTFNSQYVTATLDEAARVVKVKITNPNADVASFDYTIKSSTAGGESVGRAYIRLANNPKVTAISTAAPVTAALSDERRIAGGNPDIMFNGMENYPTLAKSPLTPSNTLGYHPSGSDVTEKGYYITDYADRDGNGINETYGRKLIGWKSSIDLTVKSSQGDDYVYYRVKAGQEPQRGTVSFSQVEVDGKIQTRVIYQTVPESTSADTAADGFSIEAVDMRTGNVTLIEFGATYMGNTPDLANAGNMGGLYVKSINGEKYAAVPPASAPATSQTASVLALHVKGHQDGTGYFDTAGFALTTADGSEKIIEGLQGDSILWQDRNHDGKVGLDELGNLRLSSLDSNADGYVSAQDADYKDLYVLQIGTNGTLKGVALHDAGVDYVKVNAAAGTGEVQQTFTAPYKEATNLYHPVNAGTDKDGTRLESGEKIIFTQTLYGTGLEIVNRTVNIKS